MAGAEGSGESPEGHQSSLSPLEWAVVAGHDAATGDFNRSETRYGIALELAVGDPLTESQIYSARAWARFSSSEQDVDRLLASVLDYRAASSRLAVLNGEVEADKAREALELLRRKMLADSRLNEALLDTNPWHDSSAEATAWNTGVIDTRDLQAAMDQAEANGWPFRPHTVRERQGRIGGWAVLVEEGGDPFDERTTVIKPGNTFIAAIKFHRRFRRGQQTQ